MWGWGGGACGGVCVLERWVNVHIQSKLLQHTFVVGVI